MRAVLWLLRALSYNTIYTIGDLEGRDQVRGFLASEAEVLKGFRMYRGHVFSFEVLIPINTINPINPI